MRCSSMVYNYRQVRVLNKPQLHVGAKEFHLSPNATFT